MKGPIRDKLTDWFEFDLNQWQIEEDAIKITLRRGKQVYSFTWHNIAGIKGRDP